MDLVDKAIYPLISDVVVYGKMLGLVDDVLSFDIVRVDGELISRTTGKAPPAVRVRIGRLTCGIDIIANTQANEYTRGS